MRKYILSIALIITTLIACNDDFLEKAPINSQTEGSAFKTYTNFQTYAWSLYEVFRNPWLGSQGIHEDYYRIRGDEWAGYLSETGENAKNRFGFNTIQVPISGGGWSFVEVRRANIMIQNVEQSELSNKDKAHWEGIGRFFRAYNYMELISRFGDVPWLDRAAENENDDEIVFAAQIPRVTVADNIIKDLEFAIENIKEDGDGKNTINPDCAKALLSRFGLFEGTWREYHDTDETEAEFKKIDLLTKSKDVSLELMQAYPSIDNHFNGRLLQLNLANKPGIILYQEYQPSLIWHRITRYEHTTANKYESHQAIIDMYLCENGQPIGNSDGEYVGGAETSPYHEFRNRDPRLLLTFIPPYFDVEEAAKLDVKFTPPAKLNIYDFWEYKPIMEQLNPNPNWTRLPIQNFQKALTMYSSPTIKGIEKITASRTGYTFSRHWNDEDDTKNNVGHVDKPIFFIEEVMLNYAEATYELTGTISQGVADMTINKLRDRVNVGHLIAGSINFDPNRDPTVDPLLWEIRRERMVEMMGEGFGFNDIRRWKTAPWFINRPFMGFYMRTSDYTNENGMPHKNYNKIVLTKDGSPSATKLTEGYVYRFPNPTTEGKGWKEAYYLFPVPSTQLLLNPKLKQNPGWDVL